MWSITLNNSTNAAIAIYDGVNTVTYTITAHMPIDTGRINAANTAPYTYHHTTLLPSYTIGNVAYNNVYRLLYYYNNNAYSDTIYMNADNGLLAMLLNNQYYHKRLFMAREHIIR